jgi:hypothetical protein
MELYDLRFDLEGDGPFSRDEFLEFYGGADEWDAAGDRERERQERLDARGPVRRFRVRNGGEEQRAMQEGQAQEEDWSGDEVEVEDDDEDEDDDDDDEDEDDDDDDDDFEVARAHLNGLDADEVAAMIQMMGPGAGMFGGAGIGNMDLDVNLVNLHAQRGNGARSDALGWRPRQSRAWREFWNAACSRAAAAPSLSELELVFKEQPPKLQRLLHSAAESKFGKLPRAVSDPHLRIASALSTQVFRKQAEVSTV